MIFIGDVAGEYETLLRLVDKCPKNRRIVLLGDLNDRGTQSRQVIEWSMQNPLVDVLYSNHGDLMTDWWFNSGLYCSPHRIWITKNGGAETLYSYGAEEGSIDLYSEDKELRSDYDHRALIPASHINWLFNLPEFIEGDGWIATHAPINPSIPWKVAIDIHRLDMCGIPFEESVIWNTGKIHRRKDQYQIHGHRGAPGGGIRFYKDQLGEFGCGIDTSKQSILTAFLWPEKTFVQQEYVRSR